MRQYSTVKVHTKPVAVRFVYLYYLKFTPLTQGCAGYTVAVCVLYADIRICFTAFNGSSVFVAVDANEMTQPLMIKGMTVICVGFALL
jgi:hypothetical protein